VPDAVGSVGFGRVSEQTVQVEVSDDGTGAALRGELDLLAYERVSAELSPLFAAAGDVVVDVSGLSFVDSSGVAGLPELGIAVEPHDG
jgi:anti-anti-sigma factor